MAASLIFRRGSSLVVQSLLKLQAHALKSATLNKRHLLSQAYKCSGSWNKRLEDPILKQVPLSEFAIQLRDQYEKQKTISAVDMEILANKLNEMDLDEAQFIEDIITKFRKSPSSNPVRDSIVYVIVRNYISNNIADRLISLMKSRSTTGLFPDPVSMSLLLDHFIDQKDFASAAQVAYEVMLQEDWSHATSRLLSLYAVTHHLETLSWDSIAPEELKDPQGEEEWIPVKYIRYPVYDDHFDIRAEQLLLGKTLHALGKHVATGSTLSNSLMVSGLALYQKYDQCLQLLVDLAESDEGSVVEDSLMHAAKSLETVQLRDPGKPAKEMGLLRIEDEMYNLLPTKEEKDEFQTQLLRIQEKLKSKGKVVADKLSALADTLIKKELSACEAPDIEVQTRWLQEWREQRQALLKQQLFELERKEKVEEIESTLKQLQEKEEMIRFFELNDQIRLIQPKKLPKEKEPEDDEETLRAKRIKRRKFRHNV